MNTHTFWVLALALLLLLSFGCQQAPESTQAFVLPEGDVTAGEEAFVRLRCYDCHRIKGVDLPFPEGSDQVLVELGGEVTKVKTYGDLLTSIVNPSHRLAPGYTPELVATEGESRMAKYNDFMTVTELVDLVAYLQKTYKLKKPPATRYPPYPYY